MIGNKVAVVIRTKDRELLLERSLKSVLRQTHGEFTAIVVNDGGSKSRVDSLISKLDDKRIKVIHNKKSLGRWPAANQGVRSVESDFIVLLDDDDTWRPSFLKTTVDYLNSTQSEGVATSSIRVIEEVNGDRVKKINESPYYTYEGLPVVAYTLFQENLVPTNAFLFTRQAYDALGGYNELMQVSADWEFNRRFIELFDIETLPEALALIHHRLDTNSSSAMNNTVIAGRLLHYQTQIKQLNATFRNDIKNGIHKGLLENELRYQLKYQQKIDRDLDVIKKQLNELVRAKNNPKDLTTRIYHKLKSFVPTAIKERLKR